MTPKWAALAWIVDDYLYLELPGPAGIRSHTIRVPATAEGFDRALTLLKQRTFDSKLGTAGDPTQHQIERFRKATGDKVIINGDKVRKVGTSVSPSMRSTAREVLRRLGMI